ncbi:MAG: hypothetical protein COB51_13085 [Moraxellaceae bacterium]|nr:MAG: hypothetical protein COB51_13085 [Moraxellaceae bacterium]
MALILKVQLESQTYSVDLEAAYDLSIPIIFDGPQVNHFGAPQATSVPLQVGSYVGSTGTGGSCNASQITMTPHCNGTHTECAGHIINEKLSVLDVLKEELCLARLISVVAEKGAQCNDQYHPIKEADDLIISKLELENSLAAVPNTTNTVTEIAHQALIVRVLPNPKEKCSRVYTAKNPPAYFSTEAMAYLSALKLKHLLVDLPSLDRMYDSGLLSNHHQWWNIPQRQTAESISKPNAESKINRTVTELIYVDDAIDDGYYVLNLQIPAIQGDAVPSRPLLYPLKSFSAATAMKSTEIPL